MDVHDYSPKFKTDINRVGAECIRLILKTRRTGAINVLYPSINLYVNLPFYMKGVHISRSLTSIYDVLEDFKNKPVRYLEGFCYKIAKALLKKHEYSTLSEVYLSSDYYISRRAPVTDNISDEYCKIYASASAERLNSGIKDRRFIGAEIVGLTYCPCLVEGLKEEFHNRLLKVFNLSEDLTKRIVEATPLASHNQRCRVYALIETSNKAHVDLDDLIDILISAPSAATFSILKREDELHLIKKAAERAMFVEDVLREVSYNIVKRFYYMPDDFTVRIHVESEESIHKYNLVCENKTNFKKLREAFNQL
ncbi:MAG: GTP cyclohydrolase MptA [Candidatus Odinarchaeum yellowstonii]|uniref:GTP cyclohydrolase MptA n=1 Tax=Odinarchaeota yellowstonii (strain LCB_4) TaxID=1841599 RepID=A0AAF0D3N4_ODILC|nr:MAG: GTP cyclohydrolase MptA [Candidatus Odinarchaeum yellowstonii]